MPDQPESGLVSPCLTGLEVPLLRNANALKLVEKYWLDGALAEESGYFSTAATSVRAKYWLYGALAEESGYFSLERDIINSRNTKEMRSEAEHFERRSEAEPCSGPSQVLLLKLVINCHLTFIV